MIRVTRLNRESFMINSDLIELVEETPNTVLTLMSGKKYVVSESAEEICQRIIAFRREIYVNLPVLK